MGTSHKHDDVFGDGFSVHKDDGTTEHFNKNLLFGGYSSDQGTRVDKHVFGDGFSVSKSDGSREDFHENLIFGGYSGSQGTKVQPGLFGGTTIYSPDDSFSGMASPYDGGYGDLYGGYGDHYGGGYDFFPYGAYVGGGYVPRPYVEPIPTLRERLKKDKPSFFLITVSWLCLAACILMTVLPCFSLAGSTSSLQEAFCQGFHCETAIILATAALAVLGFCTQITNSQRKGAASVCGTLWIIALVCICVNTEFARYGSQSIRPLRDIGAIILIPGMALAICTEVGFVAYRIKKPQKVNQKKPKTISILSTLLFAAVSLVCTYFVLIDRVPYQLLNRMPYILLIAPVILIVMNRLAGDGDAKSVWFVTALAMLYQCTALWMCTKGQDWASISMTLLLVVVVPMGFVYFNRDAKLFFLPGFCFLIFFPTVNIFSRWIFPGNYEMLSIYNDCKFSTALVFLATATWITLREMILRRISSKQH